MYIAHDIWMEWGRYRNSRSIKICRRLAHALARLRLINPRGRERENKKKKQSSHFEIRTCTHLISARAKENGKNRLCRLPFLWNWLYNTNAMPKLLNLFCFFFHRFSLLCLKWTNKQTTKNISNNKNSWNRRSLGKNIISVFSPPPVKISIN